VPLATLIISVEETGRERSRKDQIEKGRIMAPSRAYICIREHRSLSTPKPGKNSTCRPCEMVPDVRLFSSGRREYLDAADARGVNATQPPPVFWPQVSLISLKRHGVT
jgi:hypothetical protein